MHQRDIGLYQVFGGTESATSSVPKRLCDHRLSVRISVVRRLPSIDDCTAVAVKTGYFSCFQPSKHGHLNFRLFGFLS
jgi:hypothetical protein